MFIKNTVNFCIISELNLVLCNVQTRQTALFSVTQTKKKHSGLSRCGKICRLRWANHLNLDLKKVHLHQRKNATSLNSMLKWGTNGHAWLLSTLTPTGVETPDVIDLRKQQQQRKEPEKPLYQVLEEKEEKIAPGALLGTTHTYDDENLVEGYLLRAAQRNSCIFRDMYRLVVSHVSSAKWIPNWYGIWDPLQRCLKDLDTFTAAIVTRFRAMVARDEFRRRRRNKVATIV
ncbi:unnamed protein product [Lactuca saligna]|uniref:Uncharacterized protein n=1 Tax=Lactuca saligna TaxID=75948 RepID=A0AA36EMI3_LACSI|nr:unnamed protein product [Lactuca saligna]